MTESFRPTVLRNKAWEALSGKWNQAAIAGLVIFLIAIAAGAIGRISPILNLVITLGFVYFISVGATFLFWDVFKGKYPEINTLFETLKDYARYLVGILLVFVYTFLWTLLLIVPGIIKGLSYSMTFYIMRENPEMKGEQAIQHSMAMMQGRKMDLFLLELSFIGWALLAVLTAGIGFIWLIPYMSTAMGAFYEELKKDYASRNMATA